MFNYLIKAGTADVSVTIRIIDSTDGTPETGVVWNTSGIDLEYRRELAASTDITEATLAALTTAHTDGGFLHIGNGYYRLDLPDAACATGVTGVLVHGVVTGMIVIGCYIQLVTFDPFDTVRLGLTALPNAAADAAGGLPISDAGGLDLDAQIKTNIDAILVDTGTTLDGRIPSALVSGKMDASVGAVASGVDFSATMKASIETACDATVGGGTGTALTAIPWNANWDAEVQSEATDALNAYDPPTKAELDTAVGAVWDEAQSGHTAANTFGYFLDHRVSKSGGAISLVGGGGESVWSKAEKDKILKQVEDGLHLLDQKLDTQTFRLAIVALAELLERVEDSIQAGEVSVKADLEKKISELLIESTEKLQPLIQGVSKEIINLLEIENKGIQNIQELDKKWSEEIKETLISVLTPLLPDETLERMVENE